MIKACVFDAYGTLFDVAAAARSYAQGLPAEDPLQERWSALAESWRVKQLEYSWLRAADGRYRDFWALTGDALDYALEAHAIDAAAEAPREALLALYHRLGAFPEAGAALSALKRAGAATAILSNGTPDMLSAAVAAAGFEDRLDAVLSADAVKAFKPDPKVYALATAEFGCEPEEILFFSANGWDVCSAAAYGFRGVWVNRRGAPTDRLGVALECVIKDLVVAPGIYEELADA
ncbi:MAG: haloacid dehalogenase type II [Pseudomonadota bacterium]